MADDGKVLGTCNHCGAPATYFRGDAAQPAHLVWSRRGSALDGVAAAEARREEWPTSSVPAVCPWCWDEVVTEREEREREFRAKGGTLPSDAVVNDPEFQKGGAVA